MKINETDSLSKTIVLESKLQTFEWQYVYQST